MGKILETLELRGLLGSGNSDCLAKYRKQTIQILLPPAIGGKILETWELWRFRAAHNSAFGTVDECQIVKDRILSYR